MGRRRMKLKDKVCIITGAGQGIGKFYAERFAQEGAKVVVAEFNETAGKPVAEAIIGRGHDAFFIKTDVSDEKSVQRMVEGTVKKYGHIDVLINNAAVFADLVLTPLQKAASVRLEHVRISGRRVRPREGLLVEATAQRVVMQRFFSKGRYDGLNLPIEDGDYALTDIEEGAWFVKHSYYSRTGVLKGEYHNINTPVEMYPHGARYLDLEVDVVCRAGGRPFLVDREKLAILVKEGLIWAGLERRALEVADSPMP